MPDIQVREPPSTPAGLVKSSCKSAETPPVVGEEPGDQKVKSSAVRQMHGLKDYAWRSWCLIMQVIKISDDDDDDPLLDLALHLSADQADSVGRVPWEYAEEEISSSPL